MAMLNLIDGRPHHDRSLSSDDRATPSLDPIGDPEDTVSLSASAPPLLSAPPGVVASALLTAFEYMDRVAHARPAAIALVFLFGLLFRYAISVNSHSGESTPPLYGDYEAQRHWMEVTVSLPSSEWYFNTSRNDLEYWGLDYPPLTAYVSWGFGKIAQQIGLSKMVELQTSRGYESVHSKVYMRSTVVLCDLLIFFPAVYYFVTRHYASRSFRVQLLAMFLLVNHPAPMLIDHGHFQYNNVCLGLALFAFGRISSTSGRPSYGASVAFCLSLCFKQMALYFAPAFFFYLLGRSFRHSSSISSALARVFALAVTVIITFTVCCAPFLSSVESAAQLLHRLFPFARGLYEDKVANFWCVSALVIKWKQLFPLPILVRFSLVATLLALLPSGFNLCRHPQRQRLLYAAASSALSFFLFSFQVHEKTILLPLLPITCLALDLHTRPAPPLLAATSPSHAAIAHASSSFTSLSSSASRPPATPAVPSVSSLSLSLPPSHSPALLCALWFGYMATFSMFPLLHKDGLVWPYIVCQLLWVSLAVPNISSPSVPVVPSWDVPASATSSSTFSSRLLPWLSSLPFWFVLSVIGSVLIHLIVYFLPILRMNSVLLVSRYPDIGVYLFASYSLAHFVVAWFVLNYCQFTLHPVKRDVVQLKSTMSTDTNGHKKPQRPHID